MIAYQVKTWVAPMCMNIVFVFQKIPKRSTLLRQVDIFWGEDERLANFIKDYIEKGNYKVEEITVIENVDD